MNHESLISLMDGVSDDLIAEAAAPQRKTLTLRRGIAFAAAVAAVLALVLGIPLLNRDNEIVTLPGVITVKAYSPDSSSTESIEKFEGIKMEKNILVFDGPEDRPYSMLYNFHPGILLGVSLPEEYGENITYRVVMPTTGYGNTIGKYIPNYFCYDYYYDYEVDFKDLVFQNGDAVACIFWSEEPHEYIHFFLYDGEYIIGYIVVKATLHMRNENISNGYTAELVASEYFPKVNGKRQKVSMDYINKQLAAVIGQE
jgi:hypothetical protein